MQLGIDLILFFLQSGGQIESLVGPFGNLLVPIRESKNQISIFEREIDQVDAEIATLTQGPLGLALLMGRNDYRTMGIIRTQEDLRLHTFFKKRSVIEKKIERYKFILAPLNRLPPELIRIIFIHCLEGSTVVPLRINEPPFLLCRISSAWRQLAVGTPQLWNNLSVATQNSSGRAKVTGVARSLFLRARGFPLSLTTYLPTRVSQPWETDIVWDLIVPLSNHFHKLHLLLSSQQMMRLFAFVAGSLTAVEDFSVTLTDHPLIWTEPLYPFQSPCRLSRAEFYLGGEINPHILKLPWHQVKVLHFNGTTISVNQCQDMLQSCVSLEDFKVSIQKIDTSSFHAIDLVPLEDLETLNIHFDSIEHYELFFHPLLIPRLRSLRLQAGRSRGVSSTIDGLLAVLERSNCDLEQLAFVEWDGSSFDSLSLIEKLPTLRVLSLPPEHILNDWTLKKLATGEIGPRLEELKVNGTRNLSPVLHMLEERIEATRTSTVSLIRLAHVRCLHSQQTKQASRVLKMKGLGIEVLFFPAPPPSQPLSGI